MSQDRSEPYLKRLLDWWVALLCEFGNDRKGHFMAAECGPATVAFRLPFCCSSANFLPEDVCCGPGNRQAPSPTAKLTPKKMEPAVESTAAPMVHVRPFQSDDGTALHQLEALCSQGKK